MTFELWLSEQFPKITPHAIQAVLSLTAEGATVPFISRYRKEQTGNLDDLSVQTVVDQKERWDQIVHRQTFIVEEIQKQGKLTDELKAKILSSFRLDVLEDLYLPYKVKRRSKAQAAREAGLEPLADWIWNCGHGTESPQPGQTLEIWAFTFRDEAKGIADAAAAIQGAQDIITERLSENQTLRQRVREAYFERGCLSTTKGEKSKPNSKFENYFTYQEKIASLLQPQNSHRYMAIRRGWIEEELKLSIGAPQVDGTSDPTFEDELLRAFEAEACTALDSVGAEILIKSARLSLKAHVIPSIENEVHKSLREIADQASIQVFADNVRKLLLAAPLGSKTVLGIDPGIRTGCKLAVVDDSGAYIASTVLHLQSDSEKEKAKVLLVELIKSGGVRAVAVGNGTAGRETEHFVRQTLKAASVSVPVMMVSEAGASVYSASEVAREEFPDLDVTVRGAISIARRLQDPLAELVKVDPKAIGVGQYQHDVSQPALKRSLEFVVDSCVNQVGVNLNTASPYLLSRVSGIGPGLAKSVVEHRNQNGVFKNRSQLLSVSRFSQKVFEQAAGFLRIPDGDQPLDNTGVHPEKYEVLEKFSKKLGKPVQSFLGAGSAILKEAPEFKEEVGTFTFSDIISELEKPGRDPREGFVPFQFREDIQEIKDLQPGMICPGIVTNVTNFGAFVDIGVHQDGLVHLSQLSDRFVKDPKEVVSPGDHVKVKVLTADLEKKQISLSMKLGEKKAEQRRASSDEQPKKQRAPKAPRPEAPKAPKPVPSGAPSPIMRVQPGQAVQPKQDRPAPRPNPISRDSHKPRPSAPAPAFNNAFAGLAGLKDQLKKS